MKNKNYVLLIILLMVVGFASVATTLIINGTAKVGANTDEFDVYFSNASVNGVENKRVIKSPKVINFSNDMTLKDETYTLDYDVTNGSKNYDANITINCTASNEYLEITNTFDTTESLKATATRSGKLVVKVIKPYAGTEENPTYDTTIECKLVVSGTERTEYETSEPAEKIDQEFWTLTEDADGNGVVSFNDVVTYGADTFHVYGTDGDNVKLFKDTSLPCGMIEYSTTTQMGATRTTYEGSLIETEVNKYKESLEAKGAEVVKARLITVDELEELGCSIEKASCKANYVYDNAQHKYVEDTTFAGAPAWTYNSSYFTSSAVDASNIYRVLLQGNLDKGMVPTMLMLYVKPVIEVPVASIIVE